MSEWEEIAALEIAKDLMIKILEINHTVDSKDKIDPTQIGKECRKIYLELTGRVTKVDDLYPIKNKKINLDK